MDAKKKLDEIRNYIDQCPAKRFSGNEITVDKDALLHALDDIERGLNEEIEKSRSVVEQQDKIIASANKRAEEILSKSRVNAEEIVTGAYAKANEAASEHAVMKIASDKAYQILKDADLKAAQLMQDSSERAIALLEDAKLAVEMIADAHDAYTAFFNEVSLGVKLADEAMEKAKGVHFSSDGISDEKSEDGDDGSAEPEEETASESASSDQEGEEEETD